MLTYPEDLRYTNSHEYVRLEPEQGLAVVGITAFAIDQLGDVVYIDLPQVGDRFERGESFATVESVKAVGDIYAPVSGEVMEVNRELSDAPETIVDDPYGRCWLVKFKFQDLEDLADCLSAAAYRAQVEGLA
ncbi:MAG: glycine cleavage system protein GcvH [Pseudanabaenaceae cyanobacterium bins.68]|nr:glycine cleavage system protein GcvH [Pseudanabaenaceae cyanobacterium bins.68]